MYIEFVCSALLHNGRDARGGTTDKVKDNT